jgi:hypothetical protein
MLDSISTQVEARMHSPPQGLEATSTSRISSTPVGNKQTFINGPPRSITRFETLAQGQEDDDFLQHPVADIVDAHLPKPSSANLVGSPHEFSQGASECYLGSAKDDLGEDQALQFGGDKESSVQPLWLNKDVGTTTANEDMLLTF